MGVLPADGDQPQLIVHYAGDTTADSAQASSNSRLGTAVRPALPLPQLFNPVPKVPKPPPPPRKDDVATPTRSLRFGAEVHAPTTMAKSAPVAKAAAWDGIEAQLEAAAEGILQEFSKDFPACDGMLLTDIAQQPAIARLRISLLDLRNGIRNLSHKFKVFHSEGGSTPAGLYVRLRPDQQKHNVEDEAMEIGTTSAAHNDSGTRLTMGQWEAEQARRFAGLPPLPEGWLRALSRSTGRIYYVNSATGESQFEEPKATKVSPPTRWEAPAASAAHPSQQARSSAGVHLQETEESAEEDAQSPPAQWHIGGEANANRSPTPSL